MKKHRGLVTFLIISILALVGFIGVYVGQTFYYKSHFFPGTVINGADVSKLTAEEAVEKVAESISDYLISIYTREGNKFNVLGPTFGYSYISNGEIERLLELQNESTWIVEARPGSRHEHSLAYMATYDEDKLMQELIDAGLFNEAGAKAPENAYIAWDVETANYTIVPEVLGTILNKEKTFNIIKSAVDAGEKSVTIPDVCYQSPEIMSNNPTLTATIDNLQSYFGHSISYDLGEGIEPIVISRNEIASWLKVDTDYNISVDEAKVERFVQKLADELNTYGDRRQFMTSSGEKITIGGGDYGWIVNKNAEKAQLLADLASDDNVVREPVFSQRAAQFGSRDYGNTYIEIDYTAQHLWYYRDGELVGDTDVVTGNINKNNGSPDGLFKIAYKEKDATLVGEDYESKVAYFMPFAYNVGIHDASWRSEFGGNIFRSSGSHGCINAPASVAEALYDMVEVGTPVIAYYREKVKLTAENCRISNAYSYKKSKKK